MKPLETRFEFLYYLEREKSDYKNINIFCTGEIYSYMVYFTINSII